MITHIDKTERERERVREGEERERRREKKKKKKRARVSPYVKERRLFFERESCIFCRPHVRILI